MAACRRRQRLSWCPPSTPQTSPSSCPPLTGMTFKLFPLPMNLILFRGSLNNYLVWKLVQKFMPYLSKAFTEVVDLYRKHLTGAQKPAQRWEFCADTTQMFFGHLMDSLLFQSQVSKGRVKKNYKIWTLYKPWWKRTERAQTFFVCWSLNLHIRCI